MDTTEVAIVGASFAGLSAALVLGRARREVLLLGAGPSRNAPAAHSHNFLTRDGATPGEILAAAVADVDRYPTVVRRDQLVASLARDATTDSFTLTTGDGEVRARRVILATGVRDVLPPIDGLDAVWGRRAHTCPYCDGYEYADRRLAVVGTDPKQAHLALLLRQWTPHVTLCLDPQPDEQPVPAGVERVDGAVAVAERGDDLVVSTGAGHRRRDVVVDGVFVATAWEPQTDLARQAGAEVRDDGFVLVDAELTTSVPGLYAVGDIAAGRGALMPSGGVAQAVAAGNRAGIAINSLLVLGDADGQAAAAAAAAAQATR